MNALSQARRDIADQLGAVDLSWAGFRAFTYWPVKHSAPAAYVVPASPYLSNEFGHGAFGEMKVNIAAVLLAGKADNKDTADRLDELVLKALRALDHQYDEVSEFYSVATDTGNQLACQISVPRLINLRTATA